MKTKHFIAAVAIAAALGACVSSESEKLKSARTLQTEVIGKAQELDSLLMSEIIDLSAQRETMSSDTTLATDSLAMLKFTAFKNKIGELEGLYGETIVWRDGLILLPSKEALTKGAKNPFGNQANDSEVQSKIAEYQTQLTEFTERARAIRSKE